MDRRDFVIGSTAGLAAAASPVTASAQDSYPSRPITVINAFPPGGSSDLVIRPYASVLETLVKQPVVVETKQGAAGAIGAQVAAAAKPDGYTLLVHLVSLSGFAEVDRVYGRPVKFTLDDFIPIARFISDPLVLITSADTPYKTLKDLVEDARKRPGQLIFSSSGMHGAAHLPVALLLKSAGIAMKHLPTPGGGAGDHGTAGQQYADDGRFVRGGQHALEIGQGSRTRLLRRQTGRRIPGCADR